MRILGARTHDADQTTTMNMLTTVGLMKPEIMLNVMHLYENRESTFSSFLSRKGLTMEGLYTGYESDTFKVAGNRKVMWPMKGFKTRKGQIVTNVVGSTPGAGNAEFTLSVNIDFFSANDVLELGDRRTLLFVLSKTYSSENVWNYRVKLVTNNATAYCDPALLQAGCEIGVSHTGFPELSRDAAEKHTYPEWHVEYMTIQRLKHTISGSANASKVWLEHNGEHIWDYSQNIDMLQLWAQYQENALIFGRTTVDPNTDVVSLKDDEGKDIAMGNGLFAQGDGALKFQYNNLTIKTIEKVMENMDELRNSDGLVEVAVCGGRTFTGNFQRLMRDVLQQNPQPLFSGGGDDGDGIRTRFSWYEFNGVRIYVMRCHAFDDPSRPQRRDAFGNSNMSERAFFVNLGNTVGGDPNVQLLTVGNDKEDRRFVARIINGMTGGGASANTKYGNGKYLYAATPVDGKQVHVLSESGVIMRNPYGFAELFKAYSV